MNTYTVSYDITFRFWHRVRLLFGLPVHVRVIIIGELQRHDGISVTVLPKGVRPNVVYNASEMSKLAALDAELDEAVS